jgi:hypothetical protein
MAPPARDRFRLFPSPVRRFLDEASALRPFSLRFRDPETERAFQAVYFRDNLTYLRLAHLLGIGTWAAFALLARYLLTNGGGTADLVIRFGVAIPIVIVSLALTYASWYPRQWQPVLFVVLLANGMTWVIHRAVVPSAGARWAFAGLILILSFNYVLSRIQFIYSAAAGVVLIVFYDIVAIAFTDDRVRDLIFANFFLAALATTGMAERTGSSGSPACCSSVSRSSTASAGGPTTCSATPCPARSSSSSRSGTRTRKPPRSPTRCRR